METRKAQITGRSTYVISLPKSWVNKVQINKGDSLGMIPRSDGTLLIKPKITEQGEKLNEQLTKNITVETQDIEEFIREFIGVYLAGYNTIDINFKKPFSKNMRQYIRELSHSVTGPEIIDESMNSVTVKDLLDASDFSIIKGVKRMYIITRGMYMDAINSFDEKDKEITADVESRDYDVDKINWLISKQFNLILKDIFFADKMGVKPQEALNYLLTARSIERIADHAVRFSDNTKKIKQKTIIDKEIVEIGGQILEIFDGAINAMFRKDTKNAHEIIRKSKKNHAFIEKLRQEILKIKSNDIVTIVSLIYILDSLDRTRGYTENIAEIGINNYFVS